MDEMFETLEPLSAKDEWESGKFKFEPFLMRCMMMYGMHTLTGVTSAIWSVYHKVVLDLITYS